MVYYLQEIVFGIFEYDEDTLILEYYLDGTNDVGMVELSAQRHLPYGGLRDSRILDLAFLVRLEPDGESIRMLRSNSCMNLTS